MIQRARLLSWGGVVPPEVASARGPFGERRGLLLELMDDDGITALGEATPLPDARDGAERCRAAIEALPWRELHVPADARGLGALQDDATLPAAAAFALDTALATLAAHRSGTTLARWFTGRPPERVPRSVLVGTVGDDATHARALAALARGVQTLKLKVTCRDVGAEAAWLSALRATIGAAPRLRLDCNGALAPADAPAALAAFAAAGPELVEEPCAGEALLELGAQALPWFADESLARPDLRARLLAHAPVAGVVLKPTVIGGLVASLRLAEQAFAADKQVIVTHAFEGPIALAACADLALALGSRALPPGLDRHAALPAFCGWDVPQLAEGGAYVDPASGLSTRMGGARSQLGDLLTKSMPHEPHTGLQPREIWSWTR